MSLIWLIVIVLLVLWLFGSFGPRVNSGVPNLGGSVHILIVIVVILVILHLMGYL